MITNHSKLDFSNPLRNLFSSYFITKIIIYLSPSLGRYSMGLIHHPRVDFEDTLNDIGERLSGRDWNWRNLREDWKTRSASMWWSWWLVQSTTHEGYLEAFPKFLCGRKKCKKWEVMREKCNEWRGKLQVVLWNYMFHKIIGVKLLVDDEWDHWFMGLVTLRNNN